MRLGYQSIDALQNTLAAKVFHYAYDSKKAAGRALGTLVEVVTYYMLCSWGVRNHIVIERRLPEFGNSDIRHNVEFSLHPILSLREVGLESISLPITPAKVRKRLPFLRDYELKSNQILSSKGVKRNATILTENDAGPIVANIDSLGDSTCSLTVCQLGVDPFAIFECKRVGVEEGMKKGPQTIEKAKQGAYVAKSISSLQKVRRRSGQIVGAIEQSDGSFRMGLYDEILREVINSKSLSDFAGFILTVAVVSNHGNWFTSNNYNKELLVLAQSYDWLLFLTDAGLFQFIDKVLMDPAPELVPAQKAFLASYSGRAGNNKFTKVKMDVDADQALRGFFNSHRAEIEQWFNAISPDTGTLGMLQTDLHTLTMKTGGKFN